MFEKIKSVEPLNDFILRIVFENGIVKTYDVKPLMDKIEDFKSLKNIALFKCVKTDVGGFGISWNEYIDLECTELWNNGVIETQTQYGEVG